MMTAHSLAACRSDHGTLLHVSARLTLLLLFAVLLLHGCANTRSASTRSAGVLNVSTFTTAPLRAESVSVLDASIDDVWAYLSEHQNVPEYTAGAIESVNVDTSMAASPGGVGTTRECLSGDDRFLEEIVYFNAPHAYAYSATENTWGLTNHLATVTLEPSTNGQTRVVWRQYFNHVQPAMAPEVGAGLQNLLDGMVMPTLTARFGGAVM